LASWSSHDDVLVKLRWKMVSLPVVQRLANWGSHDAVPLNLQWKMVLLPVLQPLARWIAHVLEPAGRGVGGKLQTLHGISGL